MEINAVVKTLAALAQSQRLALFRALVVAGPSGLTPGVLTEQLGMSGSSLSFHLKELVHADLIASERQGRYLVYRAQFDRLNATLAYLTENCCQGQPCETKDAVCELICEPIRDDAGSAAPGDSDCAPVGDGDHAAADTV